MKGVDLGCHCKQQFRLLKRFNVQCTWPTVFVCSTRPTESCVQLTIPISTLLQPARLTLPSLRW